MSIESVMPSNHLILYCPLLLLPSIFHSIRVFLNESALRIRCQVAKVLEFQLSISTSNEYSGLISFRMDFISEPDAKSSLCLWEMLGCGILEAPTRCQPWGRGNGFQTEFISSVGHSFSVFWYIHLCVYCIFFWQKLYLFRMPTLQMCKWTEPSHLHS